MTFLWLVSQFSNHISCLVSSFEYRSCLKSTLNGSLTKFKSSIAHERSSLRSLVQTRWQKNKIITLYRQSNQGGLTKLSTILNLFSTISTLCTWLLIGTTLEECITMSAARLVSNATYRVNVVRR
jgi:hypothetical protein